MISERVRNHLAVIAGRVPDGDEGSTEPLLAAWDSVRIGMDDAEELCSCIDLAEAVESYHAKFGAEKGDRLIKNLILLAGNTATVETLEFAKVKENES